MKKYKYFVNTFLNEDNGLNPVQLRGEIESDSKENAIIKLIENGVVCAKGYEFLDLSEIDYKDELIQYIIINKDLNMSPGKVASQVGHVCTICAMSSSHEEKFGDWYWHVQKKVILQAGQNVLEKLCDKYYSVRDIGCNEVQPNSLTAVSLGIMTRKEAEPIVKRLQLYK